MRPSHLLEATYIGVVLGPLTGVVQRLSNGPNSTPAIAPQLER